MYYVLREDGEGRTVFYSLKCDETEHELVVFSCDPDDPNDPKWYEAEFKCLQVLSFINGGVKPDWLEHYYLKNRRNYQPDSD